MTRPWPLGQIGLVPLLLSCSAENAYKASGDYYDTAGSYDEADADADTDADADGDTSAEDGYEPETEDDFLKLAPSATSTYVFVANPSRDTVTRVAVPSLEVITAEVGSQPEVVHTTEDYTRAVTFNAGDDSVSIIDAETLEVRNVSVRPNFNAMEVTPDGKWAFCYHNQAAEDVIVNEEDGVVSYSEVSIVHLDSGVHTVATVGMNPKGIQFTEDSSMAVVVSDSYLGLINLTGTTPVVDRVALSDDTVDPPEAEEVLLVPDGSYAFVRQFGATDLQVVDLLTQTRSPVLVGDNPTDLDLTPDLTHAVAVARGANQVWIYDLADPFAEATVLDLPTGEVLGSVLMSPDNTQALLYSTASGLSRLTVWDLSSGDMSVVGLQKPIAGLSITPNGNAAMIFHDATNGDDVDPDSPFYNHYAITLMDLDDLFAPALRLDAEPIAYADAEDGEVGYFIMDGLPYLEKINYNDLNYTQVDLPSTPVHVGVLPDSRLAWVNQDHELGRMSFYDPDDGENGSLQTITGFELNSGIEH